MNKILRYIVIVGLFIIPFIPLLVFNNFFFPFITGKNFVFRFIIEIIFGAWVVLALTDNRYRPQKSWLFWALAFFIIAMFVADLFGMYPYKSFWSNFERMEGYITLLHLFAYYIVAWTVLRRERLWNWFWNISIFVSLIVVVYSLLQFFGAVSITQSTDRLDATFGNATYLAIYALFHIFITAYLTLSDRMFLILPSTLSKNNKLYKYIGGAVIILLNAIVLFLTKTRGAMIGLVVGIIVTALLIALLERHRPRLRRISIGLVVVVAVLAAVFIGIRNTNFIRNNPLFSRYASISTSDPTTQSRFILWNMAFQGFKERPIFGWGQENFNYVFNKYYDPRLYSQEQWFDRTHNVIFDWLIAGGIIGLGTYLWFFIAIVWYVWKSKKFTIPEQSIITGLMVGYFIHNLFVFDNITSYLLFFSVAAFVQSKVEPAPEKSLVHENRIILPAAVIVTGLIVYIVNYGPVMANVNLINALSTHVTSANALPSAPFGGDVQPNIDAFNKALSYHSFGTPEIREQILSTANTVALSQTPVQGTDKIVQLATQESETQASTTPYDARYFVLPGVFFNRINQYDQAINYLTKAENLSPKKQSILFELGYAYIGQKKFGDAEKVFKQAYESDTAFQDAGLYYLASAIYAKDTSTVNALMKELPQDAIASSDQILYAYYTTGQYDKLLDIWKDRVSIAANYANAHPEDPKAVPTLAQAHVSLAAAYLLAQDRKDAIDEIRNAINLYPDFKSQGEDYIKQIQAGKNP